MVLLSWGVWYTCGGGTLCDEFLKTIRQENVKETKTTDTTEPSEWPLYVSRSVVSMCTKEAYYKYAPTDGLERIRMSKHIFNLKCLILNFIFIILIIEKVFFCWLIVFNVLSTELVDGSDVLKIFGSSVIKTFRSGPFEIPLFLHCHIC